MIRFDRERRYLSRTETRFRACGIAAIACAAVMLRLFDPATMKPWLSLSCGAATGVPCIFCGTTRALHCLLNREVSRALYFNWIAFPVAALALLFAVVAAWELQSRKRVVRLTPVRVTPRGIVIMLLTLTLTWILQVALAVSQHKSELLNPRGPFYALFVR